MPRPPMPPHGGGMPPRRRKPQKLKEFCETVYIEPSEISFSRSSGNLFYADYKGVHARCSIQRIFPLSNPTEYISVRDSEEEELGIIKSLEGFSKEQFDLISDELDKRYFMPVITSVINITEDFGNYFWQVETNCGSRSFSVRDLSNNLLFLPDNKYALIDTDGNRYCIENLKALGQKALRVLDIWI